jgi:GNAT superfamily N-acetyltransferase
MLQEKLGIAPPRETTTPRTETLTADTPATFGAVNWNHCENGTATPVAKAGVTILMGPAVTAAAGADARFPAISSTILVHAANQLREDGGWVVQIIPDDYVDEEKNKEERSAKRPKKEEEEEQDPEVRYMQSNSYGYAAIKIKDKSGNVVGRMTTHGMDHPWLCVVSTSDIFTDFALGKLGLSFAICSFMCTEFTLTCPIGKPGYSLTGVTGVGDDSTNPSTLFLLKFGDKTVGKALCTYQNGEMGSVGPTLELIEIAKEWRRHGLGSLLMEELEHYFEDVFLKAIEAKGAVRFAVCYVTNRYASVWFQNNLDFEDLDGMGEELGKDLTCVE